MVADSLVRQVGECTDVMKVQPDWGAIMALCDEVNNVGENPPVLEAMVRALRKELQKDVKQMPRCVIHGLTLAGALVKNCRMPLHREIAGEKFMAQIVKLVTKHSERRGRDAMEVAEPSAQ